MKQYTHTAAYTPPFVKVVEVQEMLDKILYECLYLDNPAIERIDKIIKNEGFLANEKRFNMMEKSNE